MKLPTITHLQFQVLGILTNGEKPGQAVRNNLREQGVKKSGPGFYQMMARLEDAGLVNGWYQQKEIDGQIVKERWYKLTAIGSKSWRSTSDFYSRQVGLVGKWGLANG